ncbi:uncharacterized protein [Diabrotica undecimpunctata]|uniref:uncharacterized protein n=1 Tax=Diabrotica undecimpunctata TaxID=50387 RepID=UPI003B63D9C9
MNRSWNRNSSSSSGFVYFPKESQKECVDSENFLSFQESPQKNYNHISPNYGTPMSHSSPRNFNKRNNYRYSGRNRGNRSYISPNVNFKSWNNYNSPKPHHQKKISFNKIPMMSEDGQRDMSMFFDHTCTWNPWADLEKHFKEEEPVKEDKIIETPSVPVVSEPESKTVVDTKKENESSSSDDSSDSDEDTSSSDSDKKEENDTS